jgi:hypothetical protein
MHSIIQKKKIKIYIVQKFKRQKVKKLKANFLTFKLLYKVDFNL